MQIHTTIDWAKNQLKSPTALIDAEVLLCFVLNKDRSWLHAHGEDVIAEKIATTYMQLIKRRNLGESVAYIVGYKEFYGRNFIVNKHVLVPRPESECFIDELKKLKNDESIHGFLHTILDMGTGSGCLAITAKLEFADTFVTATDTSAAALKVAIKNALTFGTPVVFKKQSLLTRDKEGYDVILANLPYVPEALQDPSIMHEPAKALFSGIDGLDHYRELFNQLAHKHIRFVMTESLVEQHDEVLQLASAASYELHSTNGLIQVFRKTPYSY